MRDLEDAIRRYGRDLLDHTGPISVDDLASPRPPSPVAAMPRRGPRIVLIAAAVVLAALIVSLVLTRGAEDGQRLDTIDGPTTTAAPRPPQVLVTAPGWTVTTIFGDERNGEMGFVNGDQSVELAWAPVEGYGDYVVDRRKSSSDESTITVDGHEGVLFTNDLYADGAPGHGFDALWPAGDHWFELRGGAFGSADELRALASTLASVDDQTWFAAMPDEAVLPTERQAILDEAMADIPAPPALDLSAITDAMGVADRTLVQIEVVEAVACGWIDQWVIARRNGDAAAASVAVEAMSSSPSWAVLEGETPAVGDVNALTIREYAEAMRTDSALPYGRSIEENYEADFECDRWRQR